jgi:putative FmdB family regulatory protein
MPVYEYACEKCKHEFEAEQRISDEPIRVCPKCRARKVKRLISRTSFVLKGSGWYSDLYASPGAKKDGDAEAAKSSDKTAASDAKSDTKSETKSESSTSETKPAAKSDAKGKDKAKSKSKAA